MSRDPAKASEEKDPPIKQPRKKGKNLIPTFSQNGQHQPEKELGAEHLMMDLGGRKKT